MEKCSADVEMDASDGGAGAESAQGGRSHGGGGGDGMEMVAGDGEGGVEVKRWCAERCGRLLWRNEGVVGECDSGDAY